MAEEDQNGSYLLIRVSEGTAQLGEHDASSVASALAKVLSQDEIREHLSEVELSTELVEALRGAIRLNEMRSAVAQLQHHLDADETTEQVYQQWRKEHTWAFGNPTCQHRVGHFTFTKLE